MIEIEVILYALAAFLTGAIPFSFVITKLVAQTDIRNVGSGNPGATNVVRALNIWYGILVLFLDAMKGFIPIFFLKYHSNPAVIPVVALSLVLGHNYSPYLKFKGGKGVATSFGIFLALSPVPILIVGCIFTFITSIFKFVSFGSIMASLSYPFVAYITGDREYIWLAIMLAVIIIYRHKLNLIRLWHGKEKRSI